MKYDMNLIEDELECLRNGYSKKDLDRMRFLNDQVKNCNNELMDKVLDEDMAEMDKYRESVSAEDIEFWKNRGKNFRNKFSSENDDKSSVNMDWE